MLPLANEVWGKVMFLHLSVILYGRVSAPLHAGIHTLLGRHPPADSPLADNPLWDTVNKRVVRILLECIFIYTGGLLEAVSFEGMHKHSLFR